MMSVKSISPWERLAQREKRASALLGKECLPLIDLVSHIYDAIHLLVALRHKRSHQGGHVARYVGGTLLMRLADDLRGTVIMATQGYGTQALSIASTIFETAHCIAAIGSSDDEALSWLKHNSEHSSFKRIYEITQQAYSNRDVYREIEGLAEEAYASYRRLCMAKHSNPIFELQRVQRYSNRSGIRKSGPDVSQGGIRDCIIALYYSACLAMFAFDSYKLSHFLHSLELHASITEVRMAFKKAYANLHERWPDAFASPDIALHDPLEEIFQRLSSRSPGEPPQRDASTGRINK